MKPCQARALVFTTWRTCQAHALFSPNCEVIMLIHSLFSPTCEFTRLMHSFSPSGIKLMHFYHQLLNLSGLCTFFFFTTVWTYQAHALFLSPPCEPIKLMHSLFTTVWTYQSHALFFRLLAFRPVSYTCKNIVVLRNRVEGTWRYCNDENYVVQKPCLVYSFG